MSIGEGSEANTRERNSKNEWVSGNRDGEENRLNEKIKRTSGGCVFSAVITGLQDENVRKVISWGAPAGLETSNQPLGRGPPRKTRTNKSRTFRKNQQRWAGQKQPTGS